MGVEGGGLRGAILLRGEQFAEPGTLRLPSAILVGGENLRQSAPTHIAHQGLLFLGRGLAALGLHGAENLDGEKVGVAFLFERACTQMVAGANAIAARMG